MRNVAFVEVFAVVCGLEPELTQCFTLGVWAYDAIGADEAGKADAVESLSVEYGCGVADAFSEVCI